MALIDPVTVLAHTTTHGMVEWFEEGQIDAQGDQLLYLGVLYNCDVSLWLLASGHLALGVKFANHSEWRTFDISTSDYQRLLEAITSSTFNRQHLMSPEAENWTRTFMRSLGFE